MGRPVDQALILELESILLDKACFAITPPTALKRLRRPTDHLRKETRDPLRSSQALAMLPEPSGCSHGQMY